MFLKSGPRQHRYAHLRICDLGAPSSQRHLAEAQLKRHP